MAPHSSGLGMLTLVVGLSLLAITSVRAAEGAAAIPDVDVDTDPRFFPFAMPLEQDLVGAANVTGWLEKPAGKGGFVRIENGRLVDGAGKRLRLLGMNVCFSGNFPTREEAEQTARRLAALGINCVRFHHLDMQKEPSGIWDRNYDDARHLSAEMLDRLDYFIHQLKQNGVYSDLNLRVMHKYTEADGFGEDRPGTDKGVDNYLPAMIELQKQYARMLLTHRNPYTGNRYVDEPAVALVEITNENSLYSLWNEGGLLSRFTGEGLSRLPTRYTDPLREKWNAWLRERYATAATLREAWTGAAHQVTDEAFAARDVPILQGELSAYGRAALADAGRFLVQVVGDYMRQMDRFLKEDLAVKAPVIGTQIGFGTPLDQAGLDVIDVHSYWHHPLFLGQPWQDPWVVMQQALVNHPVGAMAVFGLGLEGKPLVCSEYCHPFPNVFAAEQVPITAAYGAFQDMDGLIYFAWSHERQNLRDLAISPFFDHHPHVAKLVTLPFASALFVRGDVEAARRTLQVTLPSDGLAAALGTEELFMLFHRTMVEQGRDAFFSAMPPQVIEQMLGATEIRTLPPAAFKLEPREMLLSRLRMRLGDAYELPSGGLPEDGVYVCDTGQLRWDASEPGRGYLTVDTPRAKGAVGFVGGRTIKLGPLTVSVGDTFLDGFAVVTLVAVEGEIGRPGFRGLLSCVGHVQNRGQKWKDAQKNSLAELGQGPPLAEGIRADISLEGPQGLRAWALEPTGERREELPVEEVGGGLLLRTGPQYRTLWYELATE